MDDFEYEVDDWDEFADAYDDVLDDFYDLDGVGVVPPEPQSDGHWHVVDGIPQDHTWEQCPNNPKNVVYEV